MIRTKFNFPEQYLVLAKNYNTNHRNAYKAIFDPPPPKKNGDTSPASPRIWSAEFSAEFLQVKYQRLSIPDCSCVFHAKKTSGRILTGDATLKRSALQLDITVHGILWVFDQLVEQRIILPKKAYEKLTQEKNQRLPVNECGKRLKKWKQR